MCSYVSEQKGMPKILKFSVVIPAYNSERFIVRALQSVLKQTLKPFEVIVVDDGSTDNTASTVHAFCNDIKVIRQANKGPAKARNTGIHAAQGDWIAFLDSDDEWLEHHLAQADSVLSKHSDLHWYFAQDIIRCQESGRTLYYKPLNKKLLNNSCIDNCFTAEARASFMTTISAVVKRSTLLELGGFNEALMSGEDKEMWFRIGLTRQRVGYGIRLSAIYWSRPGSITTTRTSTARDRFNYILHLKRLAASKGSGKALLSQPFLIDLCRRLIPQAIRFNEPSVLDDIYRVYGYKLGGLHILLILLGKVIPPSLMPMIKKLKSIFNPW